MRRQAFLQLPSKIIQGSSLDLPPFYLTFAVSIHALKLKNFKRFILIETYLYRFFNSQTAKACNLYPALTLHRAPHKPFLLLSIMDLVTQG